MLNMTKNSLFLFFSSETMIVVLGAHDITKEEKSQQSIHVAKYHQHPKYNGLVNYDIMLLKVS